MLKMNILTTDKLNDLIAIGEVYSLEFKRTAANLGREMCAFANVALIPDELQRNDVLVNLKVVEDGQITQSELASGSSGA